MHSLDSLSEVTTIRPEGTLERMKCPQQTSAQTAVADALQNVAPPTARDVG